MPRVENPFTEAQMKEIILQYGVSGGPTRVRRWFRKKYPDIPNSRIPSARQFSKLMDRFKKNGSVHKQDNGGRKVTVMTEENIELVQLSLRKEALWTGHYLKWNVVSGWRTN